MSKPSSSYAESKSSINHCFSADLNGNHLWDYERTIPDHNRSQHQHNSTGRKKSNIRLNDQLVPKPTDINILEKMTKTATVKEHPYSSHISRVAMFPSFSSPHSAKTSVRAASQPFSNIFIPNRAPDVTVVSKAIGSPYRHEIIGTPLKTKRKGISRIGENGFLDHARPFEGENQVFYPPPPKAILPKPELCSEDLILSERTSNMLKNLERALWTTCYQMHYTRSELANPLKRDGFTGNMSNLTGIMPPAPLQERSYHMFVPSNPKQECEMRQGSKAERSTCSSTAAGLQNMSLISNQSTFPAIINPHRPQEDAEDLLIGEENLKVGALPTARGWTSAESHVGLPEQEVMTGRREHFNVFSSSSVLPQPPILPVVHSVDRTGSVDRARRGLTLLDLQNSFSKSEAHQHFNNSTTRALVDLRDNVVSGKKHNFYGINGHYIRG